MSSEIKPSLKETGTLSERICRACLCSSPNTFHSFLEHVAGRSIFEIFATTIPTLHIEPGADEMPNLLCETCLSNLIIAFRFQQMCIVSDQKFRAVQRLKGAEVPKPDKDPLVQTEQQSTNSIKLEEVLIATNWMIDNTEKEIASEAIKTKEYCCEIVYSTDSDEKPDARKRGNGHFPCTECGMDFDRPFKLRRHLNVHSKRKIKPVHLFTCQYCSQVFKNSTQLGKHSRTHPENQKYKCHKCAKVFVEKSDLLEHANLHEGVKQFVCKYCDKAFQQSGTLKDHLRTHTGEKPFLCPECGKAFRNSGNMRQHLLRHTGEKPCQCPECPSKFACKSDLKKHMSTHLNVKPHVCDICGSSFTRFSTLTKHKRIHIGKRPHKCEECQMTFVFDYHLRQHMRTHTGEKPFSCKYCERAFAERGNLNKHLRSHIGEKTYRCDRCQEAFKYQNELRAHLNEHYKADLAAQEVKITEIKHEDVADE